MLWSTRGRDIFGFLDQLSPEDREHIRGPGGARLQEVSQTADGEIILHFIGLEDKGRSEWAGNLREEVARLEVARRQERDRVDSLRRLLEEARGELTQVRLDSDRKSEGATKIIAALQRQVREMDRERIRLEPGQAAIILSDDGEAPKYRLHTNGSGAHPKTPAESMASVILFGLLANDLSSKAEDQPEE